MDIIYLTIEKSSTSELRDYFTHFVHNVFPKCWPYPISGLPTSLRSLSSQNVGLTQSPRIGYAAARFLHLLTQPNKFGTFLNAKTRSLTLAEDFTKTENKFEFIFDAVGKSSFGQCKPLLTEKGIYISTELGKNGENILFALTTAFWGGKKLLFPIPSITKKDVIFLKELFQKGEYNPVIDRQYKLDQIVEAYKYVESGQKTGNVVIKIVE